MSTPPNDPATSSPPPADDGRGAKLVVLGVLALLAAGAFWYVAHRAPARAPAHAAAAASADVHEALARAVQQFDGKLPQQMQPGVVFEKVLAEDDRLVMQIRATGITAAQANSDPAALATARQQELDELLASCRDPRVRQFLDQGIDIVRRFIDVNGERLFDVGISAAECAKPAP